MALNTLFKTYLTEFSTEMTSASSVYTKALASIVTQFEEYAIPVEQRAEYIVQANLTAMQTVLATASQSALGVIQEERNVLLTNSELLNHTKQRELTDKEILKLAEDILLVTETIGTQAKETLKKEAETSKVARDEQGYDDQMLIEMVKQQSSVASFAVNSNSDSAQNALDNLKCLMTQVVSRVDTILGETECTLTTYTPPV